MSQWVEERLAPVLDKEEKARLEGMYAGLYALEGMVEEGPIDASATIDDYLYGWSGEAKEAREPGT